MENEMVARESGLIKPVGSTKDIGEAITAYREMQETLDKAMPDCIQTIQGKKFRKKNYWRAVKTAFNLSVECIKEEKIIEPDDWGYVVTYRAIAPNGASADGDGACTFTEKNKGNMAATLHNIRSQAHTRAFNRAVSNLVGFGEVSAEEVFELHGQTEKATQPIKPPQGKQAVTPPEKVITAPQGKRFYAIAKSAGWQDADLKQWLIDNYAIDSTKNIKVSNYDAICEAVKTPPMPDPEGCTKNPVTCDTSIWDGAGKDAKPSCEGGKCKYVKI